MNFRALCLAAALVAASTAFADEAAIRKVVEDKLGGVKVDGIQPAPMPGLWEVRFSSPEGPRVIYSDAKGTFLILGSLYDTKADRNVTEERLRKLSAIRFDELPLDSAVTVKRGNGKRTVAIFTDPYCPACQGFEKELFKIDNVTIHYFMYPVIRPERADHSRAVWCSTDRPRAWLDLALRQRVPAGTAKCANPVDKVVEFGHKLGVSSTPTLFLATGERIRGGMSSERLAAMMDEAGALAEAGKRR